MSYQRNNYRGGEYKSGGRNGRINTLFLVALVGVFFVSLMYEVTSDGVTALFEWLPGIEAANFTGDTIVNVIQIVIFSVIAAATGTGYRGPGWRAGAYAKKAVSEENYTQLDSDHKRRIRDANDDDRRNKKNNRRYGWNNSSKTNTRRRKL